LLIIELNWMSVLSWVFLSLNYSVHNTTPINPNQVQLPTHHPISEHSTKGCSNYKSKHGPKITKTYSTMKPIIQNWNHSSSESKSLTNQYTSTDLRIRSTYLNRPFRTKSCCFELKVFTKVLFIIYLIIRVSNTRSELVVAFCQPKPNQTTIHH